MGRQHSPTRILARISRITAIFSVYPCKNPCLAHPDAIMQGSQKCKTISEPSQQILEKFVIKTVRQQTHLLRLPAQAHFPFQACQPMMKLVKLGLNLEARDS